MKQFLTILRYDQCIVERWIKTKNFYTQLL